MPLALGQLCTNAKLGVSETFIEPFTPYLLMHPSIWVSVGQKIQGLNP